VLQHLRVLTGLLRQRRGKIMTIMVVDVGGTNIRFGRSRTVNDSLSDIQSFKCSDFASIEEAVAAYVESLEDMRGVNFEAVSIAVAAPIIGDHIDVTNNHWQFSKSELINKISANSLLVVNDFVAQALAQADKVASKNQPIIGGQKRVDSPLLVIGPGTGLGVAALVPMKPDFFVIEGEGGHARFKPHDGLERELEAYLLKQQCHVSIENVISGPGLETIYCFLCDRAGVKAKASSAAEIGAEALEGIELPRQAALLLLNALASVIVDNIFNMGCWQGAVITGGVVPKLSKLIHESDFKKRFQSSGKLRKILEEIPVWLSTDPMTGLVGAQFALSNSFLRAKLVFK
jgi:glucokinase